MQKKRDSLKAELKNVQSFQERLELYKKFEKVPRNAAPSRNRNRCWVTGRSRGYYKDFGLSRHVLREMAQEGLIPGLTKSSW
jgi:small subunit ribosomal protein S14